MAASQIVLDQSAFWGDATPYHRPKNEDRSVSRPKAPEPYVQQKISLPATLMARFSRLHWDPVLNKVRYGAVSEVATKLLTNYVNSMEAGHDPLPSSDASSLESL